MKAATMSTLDTAQAYLKRGWSVIPLGPRGKKPLILWKEFQTRYATEDELTQWFDGTENNIGVVAGETSNLTIVDCDSQEAIELFERESAERGESVGTYTIQTAKGRHYYFQFVPGSNNFQAKKEWPGIDLRSEGGYVAAPPSVHPSGKPYVVLHHRPLGIAPSWLFQPASQSHTKGTNGNGVAHDDDLFAPCGEGGRNMALTRLAGSLLQKVSLTEALKICRLWNQSNEVPLPDEEVSRTVESVAKKEAAKAEEWPEPIPLEMQNLPEIPGNIFPNWFEEMVNGVARATETPKELAVMLGLTAVATASQRAFNIEPEDGYTEPLNVYVIAAMDSGNRKTAVLNAMTSPLCDYEREEAIRMAPEIKAIASECKTTEARIHRLRLQAAKAKDQGTLERQSQEVATLEASLPKVPVPPQLWAQDITPEKLATVMDEQGGVLSILSDEGGLFETLAGRYNSGIPNLDLTLKGHSGSPVRVHRASRESIDMDSPTLTMGLSPQPEILRGLVQKPGFRGCGLLARFLYVIPLSHLGFRSHESKPVSTTVKEQYGSALRGLLKIKPPTKEDGTPGRYTLKFFPNAHMEWKEFARIVEHGMRDGERFEYMRDWAGKLPGAAARVAGLLHCAKYAHDKPWEHSVDLSTMENTLTLMAVLSEHAIQAFELMAVDPDIEKAKKVLNWIQRKGQDTFTLRGCHRDLDGTFRRVEDLKPGLDVLVERGFIRQAMGQEKRSGRPSRPFEVNPQALGRDT